MTSEAIAGFVFSYGIGAALVMVGTLMFTNPYSGPDGKTMITRIAFWPIFLFTMFIVGSIHIFKSSYREIKEALNDE